VLLPREEGGVDAAGVRHVLAQRLLAVEVKRLAVQALDGEVSVLVDEALREPLVLGVGTRGPPVDSELALGVVVAARLVEGVRDFVAEGPTRRAEVEVRGDVSVEVGDLELSDGMGIARGSTGGSLTWRMAAGKAMRLELTLGSQQCSWKGVRGTGRISVGEWTE
jgi:hypothetical protein